LAKTEQTPTHDHRVTVEQDLAFTRERLSDLALRFPKADEDVRSALERLESAKLKTDLRPNDGAARAAVETEEKLRDAAIAERDAIVESIERLRRHEEVLAAKLASFAEVDVSVAQATFREALAKAIRTESVSVQRWAALILLESQLIGRQVANLPQLMGEYLTGEYKHSGLGADRSGEALTFAAAARLRAAFDRGEKLP
jgi:hypothetical protein